MNIVADGARKHQQPANTIQDDMTSKVPFSFRTGWDTDETPLSCALRKRREAGLAIADLTASNPTGCNFEYDSGALLAPLGRASALHYDPDPRGMLSARQAICGYYADHGANIAPHQLFLTTSTSEAYSFVFRLLCDVGDEVLIAQPSYPLFEFIAVLDGVRLVPYALIYDHGWQLDIESIRQRISPRTRALTLVNPNNPTGHYLKAWERKALEELCLEHGLALIVDEVFLDYPLGESKPMTFCHGETAILTFILSGLSKVAGLPQMKVAWIACRGPNEVSRIAESRLEIISDTFLSMNAPIQQSIPYWLKTRHGIQKQIFERTSHNLGALDSLLGKQSLVTRLAVKAGWYAILRIPALIPDEATAILLLDRGVFIHPGYFFGLPDSGYLVVSLLSEPRAFCNGIRQIVDHVQGGT